MASDTSSARQAVTAAIAALDGWTVSRFAPELFGRDAGQLLHHAFAVGVPDTTDHPRDGRQRRSEGLLVTSTVVVTWAHRLRGDAQDGDYDAALDAEQDLVGAVKAISDAHVTVQRMTRRALPEGWVLGSVTFAVLHRYALP